jgi:hypothetical protein
MDIEVWSSGEVESRSGGELVFTQLVAQWLQYVALRSGDTARRYEFELLEAQVKLDSTLQEWLQEEGAAGRSFEERTVSNLCRKLQNFKA